MIITSNPLASNIDTLKKLSCANHCIAFEYLFYSLEPNTCNCIQFAPLLKPSFIEMHFDKKKKLLFNIPFAKKKFTCHLVIIILWQTKAIFFLSSKLLYIRYKLYFIYYCLVIYYVL